MPSRSTFICRRSRVRSHYLPQCRPTSRHVRIPHVHAPEWSAERNHWPRALGRSANLPGSLPCPANSRPRTVHVTPTTPINAYGPAAPLRYVQSRDVTLRIRTALAIHLHPGYTSSNISARSTRAGGAMALLLCAGVNRDRIRIIGCWRSDEMFRDLHVQAQPGACYDRRRGRDASRRVLPACARIIFPPSLCLWLFGQPTDWPPPPGSLSGYWEMGRNDP